jgi:hypothetical protein
MKRDSHVLADGKQAVSGHAVGAFILWPMSLVLLK